ncbi:hypothetical protein Rumeso_03423 [Rubellimicrobium mesophilum DSM 19309]|uniref:Helix-turn-helix domain-containing protein n=1 Tax=Rubellimicrobium mesophilum DSM 19309 TaxID=442562 RepID=A0A017HMJ9_9RHOB|nr:helix-turn-helix domain-containing protein [Rubellimicrobium mesophilum]EYD74999.1 hypothetical protein Rumeso_03423 [Rubellimicrobium mesophilum DSM 19309]
MPTDESQTIKEVAAILGVPVAPLRHAAERHGFLIMFGRHARLKHEDLDALVQAQLLPPQKGPR